MKGFFLLTFLSAIAMIMAQRPFYAGLKPIGYPELAQRFQTDEVPETTPSLANRVGEDGQPISTTTIRLPVDALGDKDLVDRISKWPVDKQPFWYINWKQIEAHRNQRPSQPQDTRPAASGDFVSRPTGNRNPNPGAQNNGNFNSGTQVNGNPSSRNGNVNWDRNWERNNDWDRNERANWNRNADSDRNARSNWNRN